MSFWKEEKLKAKTNSQSKKKEAGIIKILASFNVENVLKTQKIVKIGKQKTCIKNNYELLFISC